MHNKLLIHDEVDKGWKDGLSIDKDGDPISKVSFAVEGLTSNLSETNSIKIHYPDIFFNKHTVDEKIDANMQNFDMRLKNNAKLPKRKSDNQTEN